jgi:hypothetical protein
VCVQIGSKVVTDVTEACHFFVEATAFQLQVGARRTARPTDTTHARPSHSAASLAQDAVKHYRWRLVGVWQPQGAA